MNDFILSIGQEFLFWFYKNFNKKMLKKHFPFREQDLQINLKPLPSIYIDEDRNHCSLTFSVTLNNYTNYDLFISLIETELIVNDYRFANIDKVILTSVKKKLGYHFIVEINLTYYQVKKISMMSEGTNSLNLRTDMFITLNNTLGDFKVKKNLFDQINIYR